MTATETLDRAYRLHIEEHGLYCGTTFQSRTPACRAIRRAWQRTRRQVISEEQRNHVTRLTGLTYPVSPSARAVWVGDLPTIPELPPRHHPKPLPPRPHGYRNEYMREYHRRYRAAKRALGHA